MATSTKAGTVTVEVVYALLNTSAAIGTITAEVVYALLNTSAAIDTTGRLRYVADAIAASEAKTIAFNKLLADGAPVNDAAALIVEKPLQDAVSIDEFFYLARTLGRMFADTTEIEDTAQFSAEKILADNLPLADYVAVTLSKAFTDVVIVSDLADVGAPSKNVNNQVFTSEHAIFSNTKPISDMIAASDAGMLVVQDYCDPTYFAGDYVGQARTFS